jgi:aryl-alcohol dehydrogenase-like predicted oxidoreductase
MTPRGLCQAEIMRDASRPEQLPLPGESSRAGRVGLGLAALGRPAYITAGREEDLGSGADRSVEALRHRTHDMRDTAWSLGVRYIDVARSYG